MYSWQGGVTGLIMGRHSFHHFHLQKVDAFNCLDGERTGRHSFSRGSYSVPFAQMEACQGGERMGLSSFSPPSKKQIVCVLLKTVGLRIRMAIGPAEFYSTLLITICTRLKLSLVVGERMDRPVLFASPKLTMSHSFLCIGVEKVGWPSFLTHPNSICTSLMLLLVRVGKEWDAYSVMSGWRKSILQSSTKWATSPENISSGFATK